MSKHLSYAALLDAIGLAVEQAGGADVLVHELPEHVLVSFVTPTEQQVVRWTRAEIVRLHATARAVNEGARTRHGGLARFHGQRCGPGPDQASVRARLRVVGQYLDGRAARALVLQEHAGGYYVTFTNLQRRTMDVIRTTELLDAAHVEALLAQPRAAQHTA